MSSKEDKNMNFKIGETVITKDEKLKVLVSSMPDKMSKQLISSECFCGVALNESICEGKEDIYKGYYSWSWNKSDFIRLKE